MVLDLSFRVTVVTINESLRITKLWRHWLGFDVMIETVERHLHIDETSAADRALERILHMLVIAGTVDTVAATHEDHSLERIEHILATNGTIAISGSFDTAVSISD